MPIRVTRAKEGVEGASRVQAAGLTGLDAAPGHTGVT
jgi:hypothetical protein